eukprot:scpid88640/ scgid9206/ 
MESFFSSAFSAIRLTPTLRIRHGLASEKTERRAAIFKLSTSLHNEKSSICCGQFSSQHSTVHAWTLPCIAVLEVQSLYSRPCLHANHSKCTLMTDVVMKS